MGRGLCGLVLATNSGFFGVRPDGFMGISSFEGLQLGVRAFSGFLKLPARSYGNSGRISKSEMSVSWFLETTLSKFTKLVLYNFVSGVVSELSRSCIYCPVIGILLDSALKSMSDCLNACVSISPDFVWKGLSCGDTHLFIGLTEAFPCLTPGHFIL